MFTETPPIAVMQSLFLLFAYWIGYLTLWTTPTPLAHYGAKYHFLFRYCLLIGVKKLVYRATNEVTVCSYYFLVTAYV